jgi:uncharacterized protein
MHIATDRDPAHDFSHTMRVLKIAEQIGKEENADMEILAAAALLHDIVVYPKGSKARGKAADKSARIAEELLEAQGWAREKVDGVAYCIKSHSYSKNIVPTTLEAKILQDADRLDALGAIGIARTFTVGGFEVRGLYNPQDPFFQTKRTLEDTKWTLDHFKAKLLKLEGGMHTLTAKNMASERTRFMEAFLVQLEKELQRDSTSQAH